MRNDENVWLLEPDDGFDTEEGKEFPPVSLLLIWIIRDDRKSTRPRSFTAYISGDNVAQRRHMFFFVSRAIPLSNVTSIIQLNFLVKSSPTRFDLWLDSATIQRGAVLQTGGAQDGKGSRQITTDPWTCRIVDSILLIKWDQWLTFSLSIYNRPASDKNLSGPFLMIT